MQTAEQLLVAVVEAEEQGTRHWQVCDVCQQRGYCGKGRQLLAASISAALTAKLYVDRLRGRVPA